MNLLFPPIGPPAVYPQMAPAPAQPGEKRPNLLLLDDSYTWGLMLFSPYMQREFADDTRFWFYNNSVHIPDSMYHDTGIKANSLDLKSQLETRRFVVLLLTEHNLSENEFGFPERAYHLYRPFTAADEAAVDAIARKMASQATWKEQTKDPNFDQDNRQRAHDLYDRQQLMGALAHTPAQPATKKASN